MDTITLVNRLDVPEISCYRREICGDHVTVTYAWRGPLESLWRGVMIVRNGDDTTEYRSGPYTTPGLATVAAAALAPPQIWHSDTLGRVTIPTD